MANELIPHPRTLADELAAELAAVLGALAGTAGTATPVADRVDATWVVPVELRGAVAGTVSMGFTAADVAALVRLITGRDAEPELAAVMDILYEASARAVSALGDRPVARGLELTPRSPRHDDGGDGSPEGEAVAYRITLTPECSPTVVFWIGVERASASGSAASGADAAARNLSDARSPAPNLDVILDIDLPLSVRFGETEMTLEALTRLGPGSMIDLGRSPDDPVDVLINGRLVARAEVVVVSGNYGVRILEILSAADRVRSLAG
jgi:flagellar motor switch protein FliN/FliY